MTIFKNLFSSQTIDFYGDFVDPFGYIGFHNLRLAADECGITIRWKGFELDPETPEGGYDLQTADNSYLRAGMAASLQNFALKAGILLQDPTFAPKTRFAHALVLFWKGPSTVKNPLIERIYQAYLSERKNIGEASILVDIARSFGPSEKECKAMLNRDPSRVIQKHRKEATDQRFAGMPAYRFRNQTYFGARNSDQWRQVFKP